jgi:hypothetical protein
MLGSIDSGATLQVVEETVTPTLPLVNRLGMTWRKGDMPGFELAQNMPNAYFGNSRDGVYMPLKLTRSCQKWRSEATLYQNWGITGTNEDGNYPAAGEDYLRPIDGTAVSCASTIPITADVDPLAQWPFWGPDGELAVLKIVDYGGGKQGIYGFGTPATSELCNDTIGAICFRNLDLTSRLSIVYRVGFEIQVQPGTALTPLQKLSPPHDEQAISSYFAIARELKDAHPADFNDLGKIWDVISSVGKTVLPAVTPFLGPVAPALGAGLALGDRVRRGLETGRNPPSLADREIASKAITEAVTGMPKPRKDKSKKKVLRK